MDKADQALVEIRSHQKLLQLFMENTNEHRKEQNARLIRIEDAVIDLSRSDRRRLLAMFTGALTLITGMCSVGWVLFKKYIIHA